MAFGANLVIQRDLNFEIRPGEVLAIAGGSGCGKSTLAAPPHWSAAALERQGAGMAKAISTRSTKTERHRAVAGTFGVMFQAGALWSSMTVGENVMLPMQVLTDHGAKRSASRPRVSSWPWWAWPATSTPNPRRLSGGMKQARRHCTRARARTRPLLFLDEPSAGLDPLTSAHLDELIMHLRDDLGTTVVMVSHELESIFTVADRLLFLDAQSKTMTALGPPEDLRREGPEGVQTFLRRGAAAPTQKGDA